MDIFKLLSRSTNLGRKGGKEHSLPSSGQHANPQIFGRDELVRADAEVKVGNFANGSANSGKRKRSEKSHEDVPKELDFFGEGDVPPAKKQAVESSIHKNEQVHKEQENGKHAEVEVVSDEQRRSILKVHKIKITVLEECTGPPDNALRMPKKSKSKDTSDEPTKKHHKRQLHPDPLTSFSQLRSRYSISRRLAENLAAQGYKMPTEVQLAALPLLMDEAYFASNSYADQAIGCNLLSVAPTGSGKTLAFLIPTINSVIRDKRKERDEHTQAIVLAPTRELAHQIVNEGKKLLQNTGVRITLMRKGMRLAGEDLEVGSEDDSEDEDAEDTAPNRGVVKAHIVVSTPMVLSNSIRTKCRRKPCLDTLRHLVLDEADVLLDQLFREQVESIWDACTNANLRCSLWSATMGSSIEDIAMKQFEKLGHRGRVPIVRLVVGLKDTALPTLTHVMTYTGTEAGKLLALRQLLHPTGRDTDSEGRKSLRPPFLVFTQTIERTKALQAELRYDIPPEAGGSARMAALHSEMSETAREKVMTEFRKGEIWVIITTDLLARGVDFRGLNGVVNYDVPTSAAAYVHRVGRTGRAGREGGVAVTFYTKDDIPYVKPIANVISASEKLRAAEGKGESNGTDLQQWMLDALPNLSKRDKKELKKAGVEARRKGEKSAMITTKSGYARQQDSRKSDMKHGARSKAKGGAAEQVKPNAKTAGGDDFAGFSD